MRYWYAYTGENLILGHGRAIRWIVTDSPAVQQLLAEAEAHTQDIRSRGGLAVPLAALIAALAAPLAVQEWGIDPDSATVFSSAHQALELFDGLSIEQAAANLFNGRISSAYAQSDADKIGARVTQGFADGDLLFLPRDAARLHAPEVLNALPGAIVFLLSRAQAERKAFGAYLRRGTPPVVSHMDNVAMAALRPVLRTWEREARLTDEMLKKGCACPTYR